MFPCQSKSKLNKKIWAKNDTFKLVIAIFVNLHTSMSTLYQPPSPPPVLVRKPRGNVLIYKGFNDHSNELFWDEISYFMFSTILTAHAVKILRTKVENIFSLLLKWKISLEYFCVCIRLKYITSTVSWIESP